jgi:hypothetical protein
MTGFSAEWLALREPVDARSRNDAIASRAARYAEERDIAAFADLGSGTGANLRFTALTIRPEWPQRWRLFELDDRLLQASRERLKGWATHWEETVSGGLGLEKEGRRIDVVTVRADLAASIECLFETREIVTASAFFDLVSAPWIERFASAAAAARAAVYAPLIYTGVERWLPGHADDEAMLEAFLSHQRSDKGFGRASGPDAAGMLRGALEARGYRLVLGDSPWQLGREDQALIKALADGQISAIRELGLLAPRNSRYWIESRYAATEVFIGHVDLFALPPSRA